MHIIVLGPPGSGKSTQAKLLAEKLGLVHIASGEITRQIASEDTDDGRTFKEIMDKGDLPPFEVLFRRIKEILESPIAVKGSVMDGYPRESDQIYLIEQFLKEKDQQINKVIVLDLPDEKWMERLAKRATIEKRSDDTPEAISERLKVYHQETQPIVDYFELQGKVHHIDGGLTVEEIHEKIMELFR